MARDRKHKRVAKDVDDFVPESGTNVYIDTQVTPMDQNPSVDYHSTAAYNQTQTTNPAIYYLEEEEHPNHGTYYPGYAVSYQQSFTDMNPERGSPVEEGLLNLHLLDHDYQYSETSRRLTDRFVESQQYLMAERHRQSVDVKSAKKHRKRKASKAVRQFDEQFHHDKGKDRDNFRNGGGGHGSGSMRA